MPLSAALLLSLASLAADAALPGARPLDLDLPPGALPTDLDPRTGRVLFSSYRGGLAEIERAAGGWRVARRLRPGAELPEVLLGEARYGPGGTLWAIAHSRGVLEVRGGRARVIGPADGLDGKNPLRLLARGGGELWVAHAPLPFGAGGASVQVLRGGKVVSRIPISDRLVATIGAWIDLPGRGALAATAAGVIELRGDGSLERRSTNPVSAIARDPRTGALGVAGSSIERLVEGRFVPVLFQPPGAPLAAGAGSPVDLVIGRGGLWYLLYPGGVVVVLGPEGTPRGALHDSNGVPRTASKLLAVPGSGEVLCGSPTEGVVVIPPPG